MFLGTPLAATAHRVGELNGRGGRDAGALRAHQRRVEAKDARASAGQDPRRLRKSRGVTVSMPL
jgi:hypothetical protein